MGRQHSGRLRRSARFETVRARHFGASRASHWPAAAPAGGVGAGWRPGSLAIGTARNRARCTAWFSSTPRVSWLRPKTLPAPTCRSSSKTSSTPSSNAASWPTASCACADNDGDSDEARVLRPLQAAACTYRIAFGPRARQKVLPVQGAERGRGTAPAGGPVPREGIALASASAACKACPGRRTSSRRCAPTSTATAQHAAVRCAADDRQALEQLCRHITRPALANERVQTNAVGQVVLKRKTRWRDGTTHLVMSPREFMQRLAALVPRCSGSGEEGERVFEKPIPEPGLADNFWQESGTGGRNCVEYFYTSIL